MNIYHPLLRAPLAGAEGEANGAYAHSASAKQAKNLAQRAQGASAEACGFATAGAQKKVLSEVELTKLERKSTKKR